jgi:hypothetical protein
MLLLMLLFAVSSETLNDTFNVTTRTVMRESRVLLLMSHRNERFINVTFNVTIHTITKESRVLLLMLPPAP